MSDLLLPLIVAAGNLLIGLTYGGLAFLGIWEAVTQYRYRGLSRFGLGFSGVGATCAGHHWVMASHAWSHGEASVAQLIVTLIGLPSAVAVGWLRIEVLLGGRGERTFIGGPQTMVAAGLALFAVIGWIANDALTGPLAGHLAALCTPAGLKASTAAAGLLSPLFLANLFEAAAYLLVGWYLLETQVRRYAAQRQWSLSGLSIGLSFPTCASMHVIHALGAAGHGHTLPFDLVGVPASLYFLWIVRQVYKDSVIDWNRRPLAGVAGTPDRSSPWSSAQG